MVKGAPDGINSHISVIFIAIVLNIPHFSIQYYFVRKGDTLQDPGYKFIIENSEISALAIHFHLNKFSFLR